MNSENLVIPFQINDSIKGTIVRLSTVASKIINDVYPNNIKAIFADSIAIISPIQILKIHLLFSHINLQGY